MSHVPHELHDEFPADAATLQRLKQSDGRFQSVAEQYHALNREIHRIESGVEPASDERTETLKKQRLALLDEVATMIGRSKAA